MALLPVLVIKFGTASITHSNGEPDETVIAFIARQVAALQQHHRIVLVSSGAVGAGKGAIRNYKGALTERKAAAAVGNPLLLGIYSRFFSEYGIPIAQSLCERQHFANRRQFLQLKETYRELWDNGIIPIANENDVVSNLELKFSDNDELATLIAAGFDAESLLISTSVGGLLNAQGEIIPVVQNLDPEVFGLIRYDKSSLGLGGMLSKLTYTRLATRMGIRVVFFNIRTPDGIAKALSGETGTVFLSQSATLNARQKWLASGSLVSGRLTLDAGAVQAVKDRKSLLAVGVRRIKGEFGKQEVIELLNGQNETIAIARVKHDAATISANLNTQNFEIAHADDIVLL
ncbi:MAG: glutamate 5-kinase [Saprospiraceae bacterium]|nr:glutamate 5-kinase [Saprospiraceae bacterium]MDZ4706703.1 glutamate 5-kinase [Saprospiraceae bacterium]